MSSVGVVAIGIAFFGEDFLHDALGDLGDLHDRHVLGTRR
jgi:hypothetical protein